MVKTGIYYAYWTKDWKSDFVPFVKKVKNLGFEVLEVNAGALPDLSVSELQNLRSVAEGEDISLSCCVGLTPDVDPSSSDARIRKNGVDFLNKIARAMTPCGIHKLSGIIYSSWPGKLEPRGYDRAIIRDWSIASMKEAIKTAEDNDLQYNIEVVNRFEQFIINTADEAVAYIDEVGSPNLKMLLDTFHMNIEENSFREAILTAGDDLGHFHIGENNRRPPGVGMIPWDEIFSALREISFNQWIVMEPFITPGGEVGRDISVYRDVMPSADKDEEAKKSCEFIQTKVKEYLSRG
jgi:D-psicose/D-tagatose/L-ribulose 3-epimerase